eukprot:Awhi_evm1s7526
MEEEICSSFYRNTALSTETEKSNDNTSNFDDNDVNDCDDELYPDLQSIEPLIDYTNIDDNDASETNRQNSFILDGYIFALFGFIRFIQ